ncbi:DUF2628 domain-containing protein [Methylocapsa acidiphila]|uniref:DUF2628 domain-containing protein n=1 Tax=Methylocapsa acidiphila TaxID=133552 RepID=UPI0018DDF963|nr:DUF2628 domain-containing protein [Methylocapsa acidiphila]
MAVYSVHLRGEGVSSLADAVFIREGFARSAFLFGPVWLLHHGLWLTAGLWVAGAFSLLAMAGLGVLSGAAALTIALLLEALLGLEANRLLERKLQARGRRLAAIVAASGLDEAESAFFRRGDALESSVSTTESREESA